MESPDSQLAPAPANRFSAEFPAEPQSLHSCIYVGKTYHTRYRPVQNSFSYQLFMVYLDLDELPQLFDQSWLFSAARAAPARFRRSEHLGDPEIPLAESVRDLVASRLGERPTGPVRLLTNLRYWGVGMNPVSFYFCYNADETPCAFVAEVNNTPWNEQHCYVLSWRNATLNQDAKSAEQRWQIPKQFHVSPFMPMEMSYAWRVTDPGDQLEVDIRNLDSEGCPFEAGLRLTRRPWTPRNARRTLVSYPLMTGKVLWLIYWQALKLWFKGAVYYPHP
ncbi:DUF1365 domain-containing protein [Rubinisphaera sp. JC750]|uniref:DUF1365 domain-containing protein n=1 Tax=Rubinisphaera sp. JC750 TaxID=2898658 RepID=UPI001F168C7C|nr:DUF1365 domain-containing protein [Rubinisphaera sp. JC750]